MELKEFIKEVLTEITDGIISAQSSLSEKGAIISPSCIQSGLPIMITKASNEERSYVDLIEFKVAIGKINKSDKGAALEVAFGGMGLSGGAKKEAESNALTEVKFSIPVKYPSQMIK